MAIKDFNSSENIDRDKNKDQNLKSLNEGEEQSPGERKSKIPTEVKNANASGDGSFGRNESSVPDEEQKEERKNNTY